MRLLSLSQENTRLIMSPVHPGRGHCDRLHEVLRFKSIGKQVFHRVEGLLSEFVNRIDGVTNAAFFLSGRRDLLVAQTDVSKEGLKVPKLNELLLFSGQAVKSFRHYFHPVESSGYVIGYLSVVLSGNEKAGFLTKLVDSYGILIYKELELAREKCSLENFSENLLKKKEELEKAQQYNNNLLSITSHDLSSPLNAIAGYLDLMGDCFEEEPDKDRLRNYHKRIQSGVNDVMDILRQLNEISEIERGEASIDMVKVNLSWLVRKVFDLMECNAIKKEIEFKLEVPDFPLYVNADTIKLKRVLNNLVSNAIKYTPSKGSVSVQLDYSDDFVLFKVKDSGIGIPESHYSKIFVPFVKLNSESNNSNSSGLGLYVASYFVDLMNGDISVESKVGKGSTFTISLPRAGSLAYTKRQVG